MYSAKALASREDARKNVKYISQDSLLLGQGFNYQLLKYKAQVTVVQVQHSVRMNGCINYICLGKNIEWLAL
jgi:hypothetical protein